jgi:hypothetical protein
MPNSNLQLPLLEKRTTSWRAKISKSDKDTSFQSMQKLPKPQPPPKTKSPKHKKEKAMQCPTMTMLAHLNNETLIAVDGGWQTTACALLVQERARVPQQLTSIFGRMRIVK